MPEITAHSTLKNTLYNLTGFLWPMIFSLLVTPIFVLRLGIKEYGIFVFINTIVGLLTLLDLGLSTSVTKQLVTYLAQGKTKEQRDLIYTANTLFLLIGLAGFIIAIALALAGGYFFPTRIIDPQYYFILFSLAGLNFFLGSINNLYNLIPNATSRFDLGAKLNIAALTTVSLVNLAIALLGFKLKTIFAAQIIITLVFLFIRRRVAMKILPIAKYRFAFIKEEAIRCYKFGLSTVVNSTASQSLAMLDRLIIPIFIGPTQLTYYSLPGNISARIPGISDNFAGIVFPISTSLHSGGEQERFKNFYVRSVRLITLVSTAISLSIIFLADKILFYWLNADFAQKSTHVLIVLVLTNFIISLLSPVNAFFLALGRLKFLTISSITMALINAGLLLVLLPRYGINGAAWAYLISVLPIFFIIYTIEQKYLGLSGRGRYYLVLAGKTLVAGALFYIIEKFLVYPFINSFLALFVLGPASVLLFLLLYRLFGFLDQEDLDDLNKFARSLANKIRPAKSSGIDQ
jgi:O-antigen/teichoic acid export membrane protein